MSRKPSYKDLEKRVQESEQIELALKEQETQYKDLVQNANSAIIRWKTDGTLTFFNEYAQTFFGYTEAEVIGKDVRILLPDPASSQNDLSTLVQGIIDHPEQYILIGKHHHVYRSRRSHKISKPKNVRHNSLLCRRISEYAVCRYHSS